MRYTLDVPVPYRIADLLSLLDTRMGKLENRASRMVYHKLITRIETVYSDPRYAFMFENANVGGDTMVEILAPLFRLPPQGMPMTILQLAGFPSEVVDAVVSVTCRMAFDFGLWSDGATPLLVCEEAHRYMSADHPSASRRPGARISRIAKEGRKYGVFLGLITQRPAELDPTILSQCSTLFTMRMTNDRDQALLRAAVADTAANFLAFLPSLGTGEAFVSAKASRCRPASNSTGSRHNRCRKRDRDAGRRRRRAGARPSFAGFDRRTLARPYREAAPSAGATSRPAAAGAERRAADRTADWPAGARSEPLQAPTPPDRDTGRSDKTLSDPRRSASLPAHSAAAASPSASSFGRDSFRNTRNSAPMKQGMAAA